MAVTGLLNVNAARLGGLLGAGIAAGQASRPAAPAPKQAERSSLAPVGNFLDDLLFGGRATELRDARRDRERMEQMRPEMEARQAQLRQIAEQMGPAAQIAFETNPEKFGESLAEQYAPQVIAAGGVQSVIGNGQRVGAPQRFEYGDTIQAYDPVSGGLTQLAERGPTISEQTARDKLAWDQEYGRQQLGIQQQRADVDAANAGTTLSPGQIRYGTDGRQIAENTNATAAQEAADLKRQETAAATARAASARQRQAQTTVTAVDRALSQVSGWTTGPLSGLSAIGGTPAANLAATIDTIEANLSFDALAEMRANSPTGGALGSITERELSLLGSTVASLRQSQSPAQLRQNLQTIKSSLQRLSEAQAQAPQGQPVRVASPAEAQALPSGALFITPDGQVRRKR